MTITFPGVPGVLFLRDGLGVGRSRFELSDLEHTKKEPPVPTVYEEIPFIRFFFRDAWGMLSMLQIIFGVLLDGCI